MLFDYQCCILHILGGWHNTQAWDLAENISPRTSPAGNHLLLSGTLLMKYLQEHIRESLSSLAPCCFLGAQLYVTVDHSHLVARSISITVVSTMEDRDHDIHILELTEALCI